MVATYLKWSETPYGGEKYPPKDPVDPNAFSWPMYYLKFTNNQFLTLDGEIKFTIRHPDTIDWKRELRIVERTLKNSTPTKIKVAKYWGTGPATKQWTPIIDRLIDTYNLTPTRAARVLAVTQASINDTFIVAWYYKYLFNVARPIQYDPSLLPIICTPRFPTYVSGHAAISGCAQTILSYFFPGEEKRLKALAEQNAQSRLYAGVHFPIDNEEGLKLGRQVGTAITNVLKQQHTVDGSLVDIFYEKNRHADLQPPPYTQAIPFHFDDHCTSRTIQSLQKNKETKPKLYL